MLTLSFHLLQKNLDISGRLGSSPLVILFAHVTFDYNDLFL